jgi:hypothetical protein
MTLSRRALLQGVLGTAALSTVLGKTGVALAAGRPRRLLMLFTPHGAPQEFFWPQSINDLSSSGKTVSILSPLQRHAKKLAVVRGVNYVGSDNHPAIRDVFTNKTGTSIDSEIARRTGTKALRLGVIPDYAQSFTVDGWLSFDGGTAQPHVPDPTKVYDAMIGALPAGGTTPAPTGPSAADLRKLALGPTARELEALKNRAGAHAHLDKHIAAIRAMREVKAGAPVALCNGRPQLPSVEKLRGKNVWAAENFPDVLAAQIDIAALALRCGLNRVVSIQCGYVNYQIPFSWIGVGDGHHNVSHSSPGAQGRVLHAKCQEWFAAQWARLLDLLEVPDPEDPGRTILDNTAVIWTSEIADGQAHNCQGIPTVLAGGGSGYLKTGQVVDLGGRSHGPLLQTLCAAMGASGVNTGSIETVREVIA